VNPDGAPVLDHGVLAELRAAVGDDEAFIIDLVETYVTEGETAMAGLLDAAAASDCEAIVRPAHTLKSTSASVGAMRLSAICRSIEEAGRASRTETLLEDAQMAREAWAATLIAFTEAGLRG
jgi:HPt (histidine-containing phosphotransfer) domain-containing protein